MIDRLWVGHSRFWVIPGSDAGAAQDTRDRAEGPGLGRLFRMARIMGAVARARVHAMFMNRAPVFRYVYRAFGGVRTSADIANRVFYANSPGMARRISSSTWA